MVGAQEAQAVVKVLLEEGDGLVESARRLVGVCEVVAGGECVGVVLSQDAHPVGEYLLVPADRFAQAAR